jgi:hypothetical protein
VAESRRCILDPSTAAGYLGGVCQRPTPSSVASKVGLISNSRGTFNQSWAVANAGLTPMTTSQCSSWRRSTHNLAWNADGHADRPKSLATIAATIIRFRRSLGIMRPAAAALAAVRSISRERLIKHLNRNVRCLEACTRSCDALGPKAFAALEAYDVAQRRASRSSGGRPLAAAFLPICGVCG